MGINVARFVFQHATRRLLEMIVYPSSSSYGITWDRLDACANALITLVSLDGRHFSDCATAIIEDCAFRQPQSREALLAAFTKLTTARGVSMMQIDKHNRLLFLSNFREFIVEVRSVLFVL